MAGHDDHHELERRLRELRAEAPDELVERLSAHTRAGRRAQRAPRARLSLAFAVSLGLLMSIVAFGGVGAAKNAVSSSKDSIASTWGGERGGKGVKFVHKKKPPANDQYHTPIKICVPRYRWVVSKTPITVTKTIYVWKWIKVDGHLKKVKVAKTVTYTKYAVTKTKAYIYTPKVIKQSQFPYWASHGAVLEPVGGCATIHPA